MGERTEYAPGTPSWVDVISPDVEASKRFYGEVMGWDAVDAAPGEDAGGYVMFMLNGKRVAGLGPAPDGAPPMWTPYMTVDDVDAAAAKVAELGGRTLMPPMDVLDSGRMAVFQDPIGAVFAVWQPRNHIGAELVNDPGSFCWSEIDAPDPAPVLPFYTELFGWEAEPSEMGGIEYTLLKLDGRNIGGASKAEGPPRWGVSFAVEDPDAATAKASELGGTVLMEPQDMPIGRFAVLADPFGAFFGIIRLDEPDP